ncbi:hypothetical protein B0H13DRAFT_2350696 [Mycena leptocephala]|nr:hypothetical protein B0H13DRAFT_2350696 [Mycena leptocephala]
MSVIGAPTNLLDGIIDPEDLRRNPSDEELAEGEMAIDRFLLESLKKSEAKQIFVMAQCWKASPKDLVPGDIFLKTFLYHVDGANVPKIPLLPIENDPSERAWMSFIGLEHKFVSQFPKKPDFRTRLIAAWPGIFNWCHYFHIQRVSRIDDFDTARANIGIICGVISHLIVESDLLKVIHETKGIVTLCTQLWTHRAAPPVLTSFIMHTLLFNSLWEELDEIVTTGDKPEPIAQLAVNRLRTAMNESPMRPAHVSALALPSSSSATSPATASPTPSSQRTPPGWSPECSSSWRTPGA